MNDSKREYDNEQSSGRTSQDSVTEEEKAGLLGLDRSNSSSSSLPLSRQPWQPRTFKLWAVIALLVLSNIAALVLLVQNVQRHRSPSRPTWLPPEEHVDQIFTFQELYGLPPSEESMAAWNKLMPSMYFNQKTLLPPIIVHTLKSRLCHLVGRGFVYINNDTALPDQPKLDQSIKHQRAMVAVFHQLHCLVS